jgi:hypothetical protein
MAIFSRELHIAAPEGQKNDDHWASNDDRGKHGKLGDDFKVDITK